MSSRVFQIALRGRGKSPPMVGMENFAGENLLSGGGYLRRGDFDHSDLLQS